VQRWTVPSCAPCNRDLGLTEKGGTLNGVKSNKANFEALFARFIEGIGGEILAEGPEESADFLFRSEKIVVELKSLQRDPGDEHARKLSAFMVEWARRGQLWVIGRTVVSLRNIHPQAQREWLNLLEAPIEGIIRKANRQIRSTKIRERLPDAKGLLLIVNDGNFLVTVPEEFMTLVARVLQKQPRVEGGSFPISEALCIFLTGSLRQGSKTSFGFQVQLNPSPIPRCGFFKASLGLSGPLTSVELLGVQSPKMFGKSHPQTDGEFSSRTCVSSTPWHR
jgi:hypothetical protein